MTYIYPPTWRHLARTEVTDLTEKTQTLPDSLAGKTTLLFMTNKMKYRHMFDDVEKMWKDRYGTSDRHIVYCVAWITNPIFKVHPMMKYTLSQMQKGTPKEDWPYRTMQATDKDTINKWLESNGIPSTFVEEENENDTTASSSKALIRKEHKTLDYPIVLLIDADGTIRRSLLGLSKKNFEQQRGTLLEIVNDAGTLSAKRREAADRQTNPGVGIGFDETHSYMVE